MIQNLIVQLIKGFMMNSKKNYKIWKMKIFRILKTLISTNIEYFKRNRKRRQNTLIEYKDLMFLIYMNY